MSILVSKEIIGVFKCGCAVHCQERFGDVIRIVTSGFTTPCVFVGVFPIGSERLFLDGNVNGEFDLTWDVVFSRWTAILTTGTIREYIADDCTGDFNPASVDVIVNVPCSGGLPHLVYALANIDVTDAQWDTPYESGPDALLADGVITLLNPET